MALSTLSIDLIAKVSNLQSGMDKAARLVEKSTADMEKRWRKMGDAAKAAGVVIGSAFSVAGLGAFVKAQADAIDALNDASDATGASIESLSALDDLARRTGGTLDGDVVPALARLNMALKGADGKDTTSQIIKGLGLSIDELKKKDPAAALQDVAKALGEYANDGDKARVMQELFGKSAGALAPLLADLAEQGELVATVTTEQAKQAEVFNKQLFALQTELFAVGRSVATDLLPELSALLSAFTDGTKGAGDYSLAVAAIVEPLQGAVRTASGAAFAIERYGRAVGVLIAAGAQAVQGNLAGAREITKAFKEENEEALASFAAFQTRVSQGISERPVDPNAASEDRGFTPNIPGRRPPSFGTPDKAPKAPKAPGGGFVGPELPPGLQDDLDAVQAAIASLDSTKVIELQERLRALLQAEGVSDDPRLFEAISKTREELAALDPLQSQVAARQKRVNELLAATPSAQLEDTRATMKLLADELEAGRITATKYQEAVTAALGLQEDQAKKAADEVTEFAKEASRAIQSELADVFYDVLKGDFDNIGSAFGDLLLKMAAEAQAANLAKALFGSSVGGTGDGLLGQLVTSIGSAIIGGSTGAGAAAGAGAARTSGSGVNYSLPTSGGLGAQSSAPRLGKADAAGAIATRQAASGKVTVNVHGAKQEVERQEVTNGADGSQTIDLFLSQSESRAARSVQSGGPLAKALESTYGLRRNTARMGR